MKITPGRMDNDILAEVAKYIEGETAVGRVDNFVKNQNLQEIKRKFISEKLTKKLISRPSVEYLESVNILQKDRLQFSEIHEMLGKIAFSASKEEKISPRIAGTVKKLDFYIKKKIIVHKLGIDDLEQFCNKK